MAASQVRIGSYPVIANLLLWVLVIFSFGLSPSVGAEDALGAFINKLSSDSGKTPAVPPERYQRLAKGVNFFLQDDEALNEFTSEDADRLKSMGITAVSIAISPDAFWKDGTFSDTTWGQPAAEKLRNKIHRTIGILVDSGMAVVLKVMPSEDEMKALYFSPDENLPRWSQFYIKWSHEFSSYSPDYLFFHTLNEPRFCLFMAAEQEIKENEDNRYPPQIVEGATKSWSQIEDKLVDAIRTQTFTHTIMVSGDAFAGIDGLQAHPIFSDPNVIYNFHYYLPLVFTHQSATWLSLPGSTISGLKYPMNPENCKAQLSKQASNTYLAKYCSGAWGRPRHEKEISAIADWAKKNDVHVWLGEFGVFPDKTDPESVQNYYRDIREIAESHGIGWSAWEYANWLKRLNDDKMQAALGLGKKPATAAK